MLHKDIRQWNSDWEIVRRVEGRGCTAKRERARANLTVLRHGPDGIGRREQEAGKGSEEP